MANRSGSGKGKGGFASSRTRRARKYAEYIKWVNRKRTQDSKRHNGTWHPHTTT